MPATLSMTNGANHRAVREAQRALTAAGHPVHASGHFDRWTYHQTCGFQAERNLPVTGVIDDATWAALLGDAPQPEPEPEPEPEAVAQPKPTRRRRKAPRPSTD